MKKINNLIILGFNFQLEDETKDFVLQGNVIPEYCKIIPFQNQDGELSIKVNIAVEKIKGEEKECKVSIFEMDSSYPHSLCLENVFFYDIFTNNVIDGILEEWHIFVNNGDKETWKIL